MIVKGSKTITTQCTTRRKLEGANNLWSLLTEKETLFVRHQQLKTKNKGSQNILIRLELLKLDLGGKTSKIESLKISAVQALNKYAGELFNRLLSRID